MATILMQPTTPFLIDIRKSNDAKKEQNKKNNKKLNDLLNDFQGLINRNIKYHLVWKRPQ